MREVPFSGLVCVFVKFRSRSPDDGSRPGDVLDPSDVPSHVVKFHFSRDAGRRDAVFLKEGMLGVDWFPFVVEGDLHFYDAFLFSEGVEVDASDEKIGCFGEGVLSEFGGESDHFFKGSFGSEGVVNPVHDFSR